jgi:hypothetical protein
MDTRIVFILRLNPENYIGKSNTQPYGQVVANWKQAFV